MQSYIKFLLLLLSLGLLPSGLFGKDCELFYEKIWGAIVPYKKVSLDTNWKGKFKPQHLFDDYNPLDIIVGFKKGGHTYFVIGDQRYDGGMTTVLHPVRINHNSNLLSSGAVLRIKNADKKLADDIGESLAKMNFGLSMTCSSGVCSMLRSNGVQVVGLTNFIPSRLLRSLVVNGIEVQGGTNLKTELLIVEDGDLRSHLRYSQLIESLLIGLTGIKILGFLRPFLF